MLLYGNVRDGGRTTGGMQLATTEHRDRVIDQLSAEFASDRLQVEELDRRLALAHAAETSTALDALVTDLRPTALVPTKALRVVFGSVERVGVWTVPAQLTARVVCGNLLLDLREAILGAGVTTIDVSVTMGNVEVRVPPGVAVELDVNPTLGNVEDQSEPGDWTRVVHITGRVTLGNVEVATLLRHETHREARYRHRWERRARRRALR